MTEVDHILPWNRNSLTGQYTRRNRRALENLANEGLYGYDLAIDDKGYATLQPNDEAGPPTQGQAALAETLADAIGNRGVVTIKLAAGSSNALIGSYDRELLDVRDIAAMGMKSDSGVNAFASLGHEVAEQTARQILSLRDAAADGGKDKRYAHDNFGVPAQTAISGYNLVGRDIKLDGRGNGYISSTFSRGAKTITVTIISVNYNVIKVYR